MRGGCGCFADAVSGFVVRFGEALGLCWDGLGSLGWLRKVARWVGLACWAGLGWSRQQGLLQMRGSGHSSSQSKSIKAEKELETATSGLDRCAQKCGVQKAPLRTGAGTSRAKLKHQPSSIFSDSAVTLSSALPFPLLFPLPLPLSGLPSSAVGQCSLRWPGNPQ